VVVWALESVVVPFLLMLFLESQQRKKKSLLLGSGNLVRTFLAVSPISWLLGCSFPGLWLLFLRGFALFRLCAWKTCFACVIISSEYHAF